MVRKILMCAIATATLVPAAAYAHPGGGGPPSGMGGAGNAGGFGHAGGGMGGGPGAGLGGGFGAGGSRDLSDFGSSMRDQARMNSQGPAHASSTGIANANENSVLAGTTVTRTATRGPLTGLSAGQTLISNGAAVGTVQQVRTTGNGSVAMVVVKGTNGGLYAVPASKLTFSGGALTTTARLNGINASTQARVNSQGPMHASATGIAHANARSVLGGGSSGTTGTTVSVGMPLFSNGAQVGTVSRVIMANGAVTRVLVQGTNGRVYSLSPGSLSSFGAGVSTSVALHGM